MTSLTVTRDASLLPILHAMSLHTEYARHAKYSMLSAPGTGICHYAGRQLHRCKTSPVPHALQPASCASGEPSSSSWLCRWPLRWRSACWARLAGMDRLSGSAARTCRWAGLLMNWAAAVHGSCPAACSQVLAICLAMLSWCVDSHGLALPAAVEPTLAAM